MNKVIYVLSSEMLCFAFFWFECCRFNLILVAFHLIFYLSASELVEWGVVDDDVNFVFVVVVEATVVVSKSVSLYCCVKNCISNSPVARAVVGAAVITCGSVNWFLWVNASGISINAGRIGARIVDDKIPVKNGWSVTISNSNSFWSICSSLFDLRLGISEHLNGRRQKKSFNKAIYLRSTQVTRFA